MRLRRSEIRSLVRAVKRRDENGRRAWFKKGWGWVGVGGEGKKEGNEEVS